MCNKSSNCCWYVCIWIGEMSDIGCLSSSVDWVDMVYCKGWWDGCGGEGIYGCVDEDDISGWSSDEGYNGLCYGSVDEVVCWCDED